MRSLLSQTPRVINSIFDILELLIVRLGILALSVMGLWALLCRH